MKISLEWLQDYIEEDLPPVGGLVEELSLHSFEIEGTEKIDGDTIIDVDVLANRAADCLSHYGIAREVAALFNLTLTPLKLDDTARVGTSEHIDLTIETDDCRRATKRLAGGVEVGEAPTFMRQRLERLGQRSINSVVDITNYVMLETGQPVHAFDFDKVTDDGQAELRIRDAGQAEQITTLDGDEFELNPDIMVIAGARDALDIAGVKGGQASGISESTEQVLLSVCNFDPRRIRRTSKSLGLRTQACKRFENNLSPELAEIGMRRFSYLLREHTGAELEAEFVGKFPHPEPNRTVEFQHAAFENLLGVDVSKRSVERHLHSLGFMVEREGEKWQVTAPYFRRDIEIVEDIIEEVARLEGYNDLPAELPDLSLEPQPSPQYTLEMMLRKFLTEQGFSEVYTYPFVEEGVVNMQNPVAEDKAYVRATLMGGIREAAKRNAKNLPLLDADEVKIFEIARVADEDGEHEALALTICDEKGNFDENMVTTITEALRSEFAAELDFEIANGVAEAHLDRAIAEYVPGDYEFLDKKTDLRFTPISPYPFVLRDIAVWIPADTPEDQLVEIIRGEAGELLVNLSKFDEFKKDDKISYAYRLVFQAPERTLSDEEINEVMKTVTDALNKAAGFTVR